MSKPETIQEILARYREAYELREERIGVFLDDDGELKKGQSYQAYDETRCDEWSDSHADLGTLLSELGDGSQFTV